MCLIKAVLTAKPRRYLGVGLLIAGFHSTELSSEDIRFAI